MELARLITAYDANQPRDERGRWTHGAFGLSGVHDRGPVRGHGLGEDFTALRHEASEQVLFAATGIPSQVEDNPQAIAAVPDVAAALREMKAEGYVMPDLIRIQTHDVNYSRGWTTDNVGGLSNIMPIGQRKLNVELAIEVPRTLPHGMSLEAATQAVMNEDVTIGDGSGRKVPHSVVSSIQEIVVHEMAHVQDFKDADGISDTDWRRTIGTLKPVLKTDGNGVAKWLTTVASSVSAYSMKSPAEFLAEAFTAKRKGRTLTPDAEELYKRLNGPTIRKVHAR